MRVRSLRLGRRPGATVPETALVIGIFLTLLLSIFEYGRFVMVRHLVDNAAREVCTVKPFRTNTPLHALTTLNDVTFVEAARVLAERILTTGPQDDDSRLARAFNTVLARNASEKEAAVFKTSLARTLSAFQSQPDDAKKLLRNGEAKRNEALDSPLHAAWTTVCLTLLNLDEAVTRE